MDKFTTREFSYHHHNDYQQTTYEEKAKLGRRKSYIFSTTSQLSDLHSTTTTTTIKRKRSKERERETRRERWAWSDVDDGKEFEEE